MFSRFSFAFRRGLLLVIVVDSMVAPGTALAASTPQPNEALSYLREMMDRYLTFGVYADKYSVGNHFEPTGWMGDVDDVEFDPGNTSTWHSGGNSIRIRYTPRGGQGWAGIYWQHPSNNWGSDPKGGFDLTSAKKATFWARGQNGGEQAEFGVGGIDGAYPDTIQPMVSTGVITLRRSWEQHELKLAGKDLSRVVGGFVWVTSRADNPNGATIYLDDIRYEGYGNKLRLTESYTSLTDFVPPRPMKTHKYLYVYADYESPLNGYWRNAYYESGWMGDWGDIGLNMNDTANRHSGTSGVCVTYSAAASQGQKWAGVYWQAPAYQWGDRTGGYNLTGAARLTFWARGKAGGEKVKFLVGGITGPYNDSLQPPRSTGVVRLAKGWRKYTINLRGAKLSRISGGFAFTAEKAANPKGATFYLDDIRYENASNPPGNVYPQATFPVDSYAMMAGHTYDNALMILAFLSTGDAEDAARARLLADTIVWAQQHDEIPDGRIRNVYYPDDLATGTTYGNNGDAARHNYDKYGNGVGSGNMSWAMVALLNLHQRYGGDRYKNAALALGRWIVENTYSTTGAGGYTAGVNGWESNPDVLTYKATEHNIDAYVAFMKLWEVTGDRVWRERAMHAKRFVASMRDDAGAFFYTGTGPDGITVNDDNFPVDVMPWGFLAMGEVDKYGRGLKSALDRHYAKETSGGTVFEGVDFNTDRDGVWWEGTAHVVTAFWPLYYFSSGSTRADAYANATKYLGELRQAQSKAPRNNGMGIVATLHDKLTTGFDLPTGGPWYYFNRLHVGATAWFIFAEQQWNPYWGIPADQVIPYQNEY